MRMKTITYRAERLVVTKQYENARVSVELTAELEVGDDYDLCYAKIKREADSKLLDELMQIKFGAQASIDSYRATEERKRAEQRRAVAKANGLENVIDEESNSRRF